ncbi:MAG TPA: aromatic acid exporter family protein [Bacillales bacterium]
MFAIGYRTMKTAIGCGASITIAQLLGLNFYISAGILTILCVKSTKKASFQSAWQRFLSCILGMVFAAVFFETLGYNTLTITILLFLFIPVIVKLNAREGVITSAVIMLHFYITEKVTWAFIFNELAVIVIGIGVALLLNSYMPSLENQISKYRKNIENNFSIILREFAVYLREGESSWDGKELIETEDILKEARAVALKDLENHLVRDSNSYYDYFKMRERQFEILERLMPILSSLDQTFKQGRQIADFLERLSERVSPQNTSEFFLEELGQMRAAFRESPLPKDREEFEIRSALLHFTNEMEIYLQLKNDLRDSS